MSLKAPHPSQSTTNRQVQIVKRAVGVPTEDVFEVVEAPFPECPEGGLLVEVLFAAVDTGMRGWLTAEKNYMTVSDGETMRANGVGRVIESKCPEWKIGDHLFGWLGWQQYAAIMPDKVLWEISLEDAPAEVWLSLLGMNGLTAWLGLHLFGMPVAGDTLVVTTAAGGVGSVVGQLGRLAGLHTVGLTGSPEKVSLAETEFGYAKAIDYRAEADLGSAVAAACPDGIDIFFDSTGGGMSDAIFDRLNVGARIIQCGTASVANWQPVPTGPRRERSVLVKRLSWQGFLVFDHLARATTIHQELVTAFRAGKLTVRHDILEGLDKAPGAIAKLYRGDNTGRLLIRP